MKVVFAILLSVFYITVNAQIGKLPSTSTGNVKETIRDVGSRAVDSSLIIPKRDTSYKSYRAGALTLRPQDGNIYFLDSTVSGRVWRRLGKFAEIQKQINDSLTANLWYLENAGTGYDSLFIQTGINTLGLKRIIAGANVSLTITDTTIVINSSDIFAWSINGNSGTSPSTNFIGTNDNIPLNIRVNNVSFGKLDYANDNVTFGKQSYITAISSHSIAIGSIDTIRASNSTAIGVANKIDSAADNSAIIGNNGRVTTSNTVVVGGSNQQVVVGSSGHSIFPNALEVTGKSWFNQNVLISEGPYNNSFLMHTGPTNTEAVKLDITSEFGGAANIALGGDRVGGGIQANPRMFFKDGTNAYAYIGAEITDYTSTTAGDIVFGTTPNRATTDITERLRILSSGQLKLPPGYTGFTGTATNSLNIDASGNIIVGSVGGGGSGGNVYQDVNKNVGINNFDSAYSTTATATSTTTLTVGSRHDQYFTGTLGQTIVLPAANTLLAGHEYWVVNKSTAAITVNYNGGTLAKSIAAGSSAYFKATNVSTTTGVWDIQFTPLSIYNELSGTGSTSSTFTLANIPLTGMYHIWKNGQSLRPITDYTISGNTVTLVSARVTTDYFTIDYQY